MTAAVLMLAGLPLLTVGADQLILGSGRLASRLGVSPVVVGVVVIGFGTSAPELVVSTLAAADGHASLAVGNLVGSNVIHVTLILGLSGLVFPFAVGLSVLRREAPLSVAAVAAFAGALALGLGTVTGAVLILLFGAAMWLLWRIARTGDQRLPGEVAEFLDGGTRHRLSRETTRTVLGLAGTLAGAELLVTGAAELAARAGVSPAVIGFTIVALGTSLPELTAALQAVRRGETDLVVGNLLGSNMFNSLAAGGVVGLVGRTMPPTDGSVLSLMVVTSVLAWLLLARRQCLTRPESAVLLLMYGSALPLLMLA